MMVIYYKSVVEEKIQVKKKYTIEYTIEKIKEAFKAMTFSSGDNLIVIVVKSFFNLQALQRM